MGFEKIYKYAVQVHFEDTDASGVVFHPNYLKYIERARSNILRNKGFSLGHLMRENIGMAISAHYTQYLRPAVNDDELVVLTRVMALNRHEMKVYQEIHKGADHELQLETELSPSLRSKKTAIYRSQIKIICICLKTLKPTLYPASILNVLNIKSEELRSKSELATEIVL